jgi:general stress protein 26
VWQHYEDGAIYIIPRERSVFVKHIERNPYVAVSCALDESPFTRALFRGKAEIIEGPKIMEGKTLEIGEKMSYRYLGERGPEYLVPTMDRPRFLVKVVPDKVISWEGVEWHPKYYE